MIGVGSVIGGRFRIDQILGAGGMGVVVAATHLELGHRVAIKLLRDELADNQTIVERFLREARAVVGLRTEHVCRVTDTGRLDTGAPYIVMEMLEGVDLQRTVARSPLPLTTAVEYVLQACVALAEAHAAGIIHRDLKPANLFVTRRLDGGPLVKVLDFGIAKAFADTGAHLTHQSAMGTPGYMSPEQIQSARDVDVRTDIWALGVTLYQLLAARLPFGGTNPTEIAIAVATDPPQHLDVPPALHAVIWKCLEKAPKDRYANIGELMSALAPFGGPNVRMHLAQASALGASITAGQMVVVGPMTPPGQVTQATQATQATGIPPTRSTGVVTIPKKKRTALVAVVVMLLVAAGAAVAWFVVFNKHVAPAPADAGVVAQRPIDAAVVAVIAPVIDAAPPPDAAEPPDAAAGGKTKKPPRQSEFERQLLQGQAEMNRQLNDPKVCASMEGSIAFAEMPVPYRMHCACTTKNQKLAEDLFRVLPEGLRDDTRAFCKERGVTLP